MHRSLAGYQHVKTAVVDITFSSDECGRTKSMDCSLVREGHGDEGRRDQPYVIYMAMATVGGPILCRHSYSTTFTRMLGNVASMKPDCERDKVKTAIVDVVLSGGKCAKALEKSGWRDQPQAIYIAMTAMLLGTCQP